MKQKSKKSTLGGGGKNKQQIGQDRNTTPLKTLTLSSSSASILTSVLSSLSVFGSSDDGDFAGWLSGTGDEEGRGNWCAWISGTGDI